MTTINRPSSGAGSEASISRFQSKKKKSSSSSSSPPPSPSPPPTSSSNPALRGEALKPEFRKTDNVVRVSDSQFRDSRGASRIETREETRQRLINETLQKQEDSRVRRASSSVIPQSYAQRETIKIADKNRRQARIPERNTVVLSETERKRLNSQRTVVTKQQKALLEKNRATYFRSGKETRGLSFDAKPSGLSRDISFLGGGFEGASMVIPIPTLGKARAGGKVIKAGAGKVKEGIIKVAQSRKVNLISEGVIAGAKSYPGQVAIGLGTSAVATREIAKRSRDVETFFDPTKKQYYDDPNFRLAVTRAEKTAREQSSQQGFMRGVASDLPVISATQNLKGFDVAVQEELKNQGYTGERLDRARDLAFSERTGRALSEGFGLGMVSTTAEKIGGRELTKSFSKGFTTTKKKLTFDTFVKTGKEVGKAGAFEGAGAVLVSNVAQESEKPFLPSSVGGLAPQFTSDSERLKQFENETRKVYTDAGYTGEALEKGVKESVKANYKPSVLPSITTESQLTDMGLGAVAGYGSAFLIGGGIGAGEVSPNPAVRTLGKGLKVGTYATDQLEIVGDVSDASRRSIYRRLGIPVRSTPAVNINTPKEDVVSFTTIPSVPRKGAKGTKTINNLGVPVAPPPPVPSLTLSPTKTKRKAVRGSTSSFVAVPTAVPTPTIPTPPILPPSGVPSLTTSQVRQPSPVPTPVPTNTNVPTNTRTPIQTPVNVPIPVNPSVPIPINSAVTIPTTTPLMRVPPPILPQFPRFGGAGGVRGTKRKRFVSELAISRKSLSAVLGANPISGFTGARPKAKPKTKKGRKMGKKKKEKRFNPFGF